MRLFQEPFAGPVESIWDSTLVRFIGGVHVVAGQPEELPTFAFILRKSFLIQLTQDTGGFNINFEMSLSQWRKLLRRLDIVASAFFKLV